MKNNKSKKLISCLAALLLASASVNAQNGVNSPYSRYGFGMQSDRSMGFNKGMAGVAQGFRGGQIINPANPASYSAVDSLTALFDFGLTLQNGNYELGNLQQNAKNSSLDYAAYHFRARRGVGIAIGALPYTNIGYSFRSGSTHVGGSEDITSSYSFNGSGGLHQAFVGAGVKIAKPLSVGMNASFLFGDYTHSTTMTLSESNAFSLVRGYTADISTWMLDFGMQYTVRLNKKDQITLGATYGLGHDVKNHAIRYTQTFNSSSAVVEGYTNDTIRNAFQLPHTLAVGFTYTHGTKWHVGADVELQKWSECRFPTQDGSSTGLYTSKTGQLNDKIRIAVGGDYTLDPLHDKFLKRLTYKAGAYYSRSYANADLTGTLSDKPYEFGVSAGVSIPVYTRWIWFNVPRINISCQWTHASIPYMSSQTTVPVKSQLTENYLRLCVGLSFSERWFHKYKMD